MWSVTLLTKYMSKLLLSLCTFLALSVLAESEQQWPEGSAMQVGLSAVAEREMYERGMANALERIGVLLSEDCDWCQTERDDYTNLLANLKKQQAAWQVYANAECEFLYKLEGPHWNTWNSTRMSQCKAGQAYMRLRQLRRVENCLATDNERSGDEYYQFQTCLYQLAPLSLQ